MKILFLFTLVLALATGLVRAANPSFVDFNTNQFTNLNYKMIIRNGASITNLLLSGSGNVLSNGATITGQGTANVLGITTLNGTNVNAATLLSSNATLTLTGANVLANGATLTGQGTASISGISSLISSNGAIANLTGSNSVLSDLVVSNSTATSVSLTIKSATNLVSFTWAPNGTNTLWGFYDGSIRHGTNDGHSGNRFFESAWNVTGSRVRLSNADAQMFSNTVLNIAIGNGFGGGDGLGFNSGKGIHWSSGASPYSSIDTRIRRTSPNTVGTGNLTASNGLATPLQTLTTTSTNFVTAGQTNLVGGSQYIMTTAATNNMAVFLTYREPTGTITGALTWGNVTNGVSFEVTSKSALAALNATDTNLFNWFIVRAPQ